MQALWPLTRFLPSVAGTQTPSWYVSCICCEWAAVLEDLVPWLARVNMHCRQACKISSVVLSWQKVHTHQSLSCSWKLSACVFASDFAVLLGLFCQSCAANTKNRMRRSCLGIMQESVEIYDARMDSWRYVASMEASRAYGAAVTVHRNVFALGGMRDTQHNEVVERYDGGKDSWHKITPPPHILHKRAFLAACVVDLS